MVSCVHTTRRSDLLVERDGGGEVEQHEGDDHVGMLSSPTPSRSTSKSLVVVMVGAQLTMADVDVPLVPCSTSPPPSRSTSKSL